MKTFPASAASAHIHRVDQLYFREAFNVVCYREFVREQQQRPVKAVEEQHHSGIYGGIFIYKLIGKNRKIIKERVFAKIGNNSNMLIKVNQLVDILKNVLFNIKLSQTQWKMIASIGDMDKSGIIDFNIFMSIIENTNKIGLSHPKKK